MFEQNYTRPSGTKATAVGRDNRYGWSRVLRRQAFATLTPAEVIAAETSIADKVRSRKRQDQAAWTNIRARFEHLAVIEVLQKRHLEVTGKEISRAEVLAALMFAGLPTVANDRDFFITRD